VPPDLTICEAAAAPSSQTFMLVGTLVVKVAEGAAYH
jgi:cytochrome bd-type quinol oxidase subunit 2